jgi:hypothetical protein
VCVFVHSLLCPVLHFLDYNSTLFHPIPSTIIHVHFNKIKTTNLIISHTINPHHQIWVNWIEGVLLRVTMHLQLASNNLMTPEKISGIRNLIRNPH